MAVDIPKIGHRTALDPSVSAFLVEQPNLHLGGNDDFHAERRKHLEVFGFHNLPESKRAPIGRVEFTAVRGPHGTIPIRLFYPETALRGGQDSMRSQPALVYMHGGGYTVGSVDEFENGLRILANESGAIIIGVEYRLAPEHPFPTQLDEYAAVLSWAQSEAGSSRGITPDLVFGGGDSAGGNMTAALALRLHDEGIQNMAGQILLYPEARLPFDTPAASENNSGYYLECNGIFSFASHYLPGGPDAAASPAHRYVSPGMQQSAQLKDLPPAAVFTCGFDPLRDVGVEYARKLREGHNVVVWKHYGALTHGFLQMAPWSEGAMSAAKEVGIVVKTLVGEMRKVQ